MKYYLLGIDIGSTNLKANLYDVKGNRIAGTSRHIKVHYSRAGGQERSVYNPDELWSEIVSLIQEITGQVTNSRMIRGIGVTGMGEPGIPVDSNGEWIYPAITWFDQRTKSQAQWWADNFDLYKLFRITGQPLHPMYSINRIMWLKENESSAYRKMRKWLNLEDYIIFKLTGNFATDFSIASRTMGFDVMKRCWSEEVFRAANIDIQIMPAVYPSGTIVGKVSRQTANISGLAEGTPVVTGGHDHGCAALAVRVFEEGLILDSTGTVEVVLGALNTPMLNEETYNACLAVYPHPAKEKYQVLEAILFSGGTLEWYVNQFGYSEKLESEKTGKSLYSIVLKAAESADVGSSGLFWFPHLRGTYADPGSRGALLGVRDFHTKKQILRAFIEGICFELRRILENHEKLFGMKTDKIVVVGAATESEFWLQTKADITGKIIEVPDVVEAASLGAAILAGIGVGIYKDYYDATKTYKIRKEFRPNLQHFQKYELYYQNIYSEMCHSLACLNDKISKEFSIR